MSTPRCDAAVVFTPNPMESMSRSMMLCTDRLLRLRIMLPIAAAMSLGGCASLPSSGPTGSQVLKNLAMLEGPGASRIVDVDTLDAVPPPPPDMVSHLPTLDPPPTDMIGPDDVLDITVYEAGVALFGGGGSAAASGASTAASSGGSPFDPSVKTARLPPTRVDDDGYVTIPYVGKLKAMGHTTGELEALIKKGLRGFSQDPQVIVTIRESITNSVIVSGEVARPGRLVLPTNRETLSDAIALSGGYRGEAKDLTVRVQRRGDEVSYRLADVMSGETHDLRLYPGDRVSIISAPRAFSVMGAPGKVDRFTFAGSTVSLAEAIAQAGGTNPNLGDPAAVFVFRFEPRSGGADQPIVYHINMMNAGSYFLAQRFALRDKDVLYFGNARANQPAKFVQIISQLFTPLLTVTSAVQTIKN